MWWYAGDGFLDYEEFPEGPLGTWGMVDDAGQWTGSTDSPDRPHEPSTTAYGQPYGWSY